MRQCELSYRGKEERTIINNRFCANVTDVVRYNTMNKVVGSACISVVWGKKG